MWGNNQVSNAEQTPVTGHCIVCLWQNLGHCDFFPLVWYDWGLLCNSCSNLQNMKVPSTFAELWLSVEIHILLRVSYRYLWKALLLRNSYKHLLVFLHITFHSDKHNQSEDSKLNSPVTTECWCPFKLLELFYGIPHSEMVMSFTWVSAI